MRATSMVGALWALRVSQSLQGANLRRVHFRPFYYVRELRANLRTGLAKDGRGKNLPRCCCRSKNAMDYMDTCFYNCCSGFPSVRLLFTTGAQRLFCSLV
jgi:hypothetical protein